MRLFVIVALLSFPVAVHATECTSDADCGADQYCAMMETCAAPACPDGTDCEPPVCEAAAGQCADNGATGVDTYYGNECVADADCPAGFTCDTVEVPCAVAGDCGCSCPACDPDAGTECPPCDCGGCEPPDPSTCEPTTASYCAYHPVACTADADCAEGFQCVKDEVCYGGGSTGCAATPCTCACEAGTDCGDCVCPEPVCDDVPAQTETTCEVVGQYCAPKAIACAEAADCPSDWECVAEPTADCACAAIECPPVESMCPDMAPECVAKAEACGSEPCECPTVEASSSCLPKGWGGVLAAQSDAASTGGVSAPTGGGELGDFLSTAEEAAAGPRVVNDDGALDTTGTDGTAATGDTGNGGCSMGATGHGLAFLLLALSALAGVGVLRRRVVG